MSKQKKKSRKELSQTERIILATAIIQLISALVSLFDKMFSG